MEYPSLSTPPSGSIRFNTDSSKLEVYNGEKWWGIDSTSPKEQTGGTRGFLLGGLTPNFLNTIQYGSIDTTGNFADFGDLTFVTALKANVSDRTRLCSYGDYNNTNPSVNAEIDYITMASTGNAADFGDMSEGRYSAQPVSSSTRGVYVGGTNVYNSVSGTLNSIEYITIQSTGNSVDFGDMIQKASTGQSFNSPTRGVICGGWNGSPGARLNNIQYITIATTGNSSDFGDLAVASGFTCGNGASNAVRGLSAIGNISSGTYVNTIEYHTIAALGNGIDFGDLVRTSEWTPGMASPTRAVWHNPGGNTAAADYMDYAQIMTIGNAIDFGDTATSCSRTSSGSNGHGGLG